MDDLERVVGLPGAREPLSQLPRLRWAIVISSTRPLAERRMQVAGMPRPEIFITSGDITHGKPHPEPYVKAARALGFAAAACIVLEDAPAGILAGESAGSRVMALRTTFPGAELLKAAPDRVVDNCRALRAGGSGPALGITIA